MSFADLIANSVANSMRDAGVPEATIQAALPLVRSQYQGRGIGGVIKEAFRGGAPIIAAALTGGLTLPVAPVRLPPDHPARIAAHEDAIANHHAVSSSRRSNVRRIRRPYRGSRRIF